MKSPRESGFYIVYTDHDKKTFNVVGPRYNDVAATNQTDKLQEEGRNVNIHVVHLPTDPNKIKTEFENRGYKFNSNLEW